MDVSTSVFGELTPAVASMFSQDYANRFRDMYLLWREAAYSEHEIEETTRADMEGFLRPRLQNSELSFTFRLSAEEVIRHKYSKHEYLKDLENLNPSLTALIKELELEFD